MSVTANSLIAQSGNARQRAGLLLSVADLESLLGVSRTALLQWRKDGSFPQPLRQTTRSAFWSRRQIESWLGDQA